MSDPWADPDLSSRVRKKRNPWPGRILLTLVLTALVGVVAWAALSLVGDDKPAKKQVVSITLLKLPPPPPPPPPPPEEKIPEPEIKEEVKVPEPEPQQAEEAPPPGEQLGLDAEGSGSGDGFGLAAKKGGQDITTIGGGAGNNRAKFAWFTGIIQSHLQEQFQKNEKLRGADYRVVVRVWFDARGQVDRYELVNGSGNPDIDQSLKLAMDGMPRLRQMPPADLPQPVKLRVTSRGAG